MAPRRCLHFINMTFPLRLILKATRVKSDFLPPSSSLKGLLTPLEAAGQGIRSPPSPKGEAHLKGVGEETAQRRKRKDGRSRASAQELSAAYHFVLDCSWRSQRRFSKQPFVTFFLSFLTLLTDLTAFFYFPPTGGRHFYFQVK